MAVLLIIVLLYAFVFSPIWQYNEQLQLDIDTEQNLLTYLNQTKQKLASLPNHPTLSKQQAEQYINQIFKSQGIKLNRLIMQSKKSIVNINEVVFEKLLNSLQNLKSRHGIFTTQANIKRIKIGMVKVQLTLSF
ncbi:MAG: hypothetical protein Rsou_1347 [Candidatus Ruthia sp. Asou_11_S2]|nr:hypothetical protein [Candidatus Ruthia sp. Asou_11_S2]